MVDRRSTWWSVHGGAPTVRDQRDRGLRTIWVDLLGSQTHHLGRKYSTRVIDAGSGEALLMLHGIGGHAEAYSRNVVRLGGNGFRAMAIDFLWHGYSAKPEYVEGQDIHAYVEQVIDLLDAEGIERAHIEGESLGGWVGLWLALEHPERVGKLILNTTAGIKWEEGSVATKPHEGREALAQRSLQAIEDPNRETIRKRLEWLMATPDRVTDELVELRYSLYSDPQIRDSLRKVFSNAFGGGSVPRRMVPEARLAEISVPTLVFWSDQNPGAGPDVGRKIASMIPDAQFYCMDDAAHWPQWEHPEEHDRVITEFLSGGNVGRA